MLPLGKPWYYFESWITQRAWIYKRVDTHVDSHRHYWWSTRPQYKRHIDPEGSQKTNKMASDRKHNVILKGVDLTNKHMTQWVPCPSQNSLTTHIQGNIRYKGQGTQLPFLYLACPYQTWDTWKQKPNRGGHCPVLEHFISWGGMTG